MMGMHIVDSTRVEHNFCVEAISWLLLSCVLRPFLPSCYRKDDVNR